MPRHLVIARYLKSCLNLSPDSAREQANVSHSKMYLLLGAATYAGGYQDRIARYMTGNLLISHQDWHVVQMKHK